MTHLNTRLVHTGEHDRAQQTGYVPTSLPIHASTTFVYHTLAELDDAFARGGDRMTYARHGNPTTNALEGAVRDAEDGRGGVACASGMAALYLALLAAATPRGASEPKPRHILASNALYGATHKLLQVFFAAQGARVSTCDMTDLRAVRERVDELEPDVVLFEAISNPLLKVSDIAAISEIAHGVDARVVVDATMATPVLCRPLTLGADVVVHSATKYLGGHGDAIGGVLVARGALVADTAHAYANLLGTTLGPFEAKLILRGMRTLGLRMKQQCESAMAVATALRAHPRVRRVMYPGLDEHPQHTLARSQFGGLFGGMVSFELAEGTREAAVGFIDRLRLVLPATSLGDIYTLVSYPPVSSHRELAPEERAAQGISEGLVRLSIGIEDVRDIVSDIAQALELSELYQTRS